MLSFDVREFVLNQYIQDTMGQWMFFPEVENIIEERLTRGNRLQAIVRARRHNNVHRALCSEIVKLHPGYVANLADIEGIDFDIINKDLVDCDDWMG